MKKLTILIAMLMAIGGCSNEVPSDKLQDRNGVYYEVNSQTPFTGIAVDYYENGQLKERGNYKDGEREGTVELYYPSGQLFVTGNLKDGERDGLYENYRANGQLNEKTNYKDGEADGLYETYFENGQLEFKSNYKDGKKID